MAWQFAIPALMEGGSALASHLLRKKPPRFETTAEGRRLMELSQYGSYSPSVRRGLIGSVSRRAGSSAQRETARVRGGLVAQGIEGSIAGQRLLAQPGLQKIRAIGGATERIERENELSKGTARSGLARGMTLSREQRRVEDNQARSGLVSGLVGAAGKGYQGYQLSRYAKDFPTRAPLARAAQAGIPISPYSTRYFIDPPPMPDISQMSEEEAKAAMLEWLRQGGGAN